MRRDDRGVSTVVDVTLAMLLISTSVVILGVYLADDPPEHEPVTADRMAETVAGTTLVVEYDLQEVEDEDHFDDTWIEDDDAYERVRHGPTAGLVADAAIANATFWGERVSVEGESFQEAVDGSLISAFHGADANVHVRAVWRPFRGSEVEGVATAGQRPPPNADVSSVTLTVPSGMDVSEDELEANVANGDDVARLIADAIVEGMFPVRQSQHALESQGMERSLIVYRYRQMAEGVLDRHTTRWDPAESDSWINRSHADARAANDDLAENMVDDAGFSTRSIGFDLDSAQWNDDPDELREFVTVDQVQVTIRTWNS